MRRVGKFQQKHLWKKLRGEPAAWCLLVCCYITTIAILTRKKLFYITPICERSLLHSASHRHQPTSSDDGLNLGKTSIANDMTPMCYVVPYFGYGLSRSVEETSGFHNSWKTLKIEKLAVWKKKQNEVLFRP